MNIRFDAHSIRYRLTIAECEELLRHGSVSFSLTPCTETITYSVLSGMDEEMSLQVQSSLYQLTVPHKALQGLYDQAPSKAALSCTHNTDIRVYLEIDVRRHPDKAHRGT